VIFSYNAVQLGLYGGIGFYAAEYVRTHFGLNAPWWIFSFAAKAACLVLGVRHLEAGARVLAVLLLLETGIILLLDLSIVFGPGRPTAGFSAALFSPLPVFSGAVGVALMFAHAAFMGFEGTAIYSEEARDPVRTVPRATYIAVIFMGTFYALTAWLIVSSAGLDLRAHFPQQRGPLSVFFGAAQHCVVKIEQDPHRAQVPVLRMRRSDGDGGRGGGCVRHLQTRSLHDAVHLVHGNWRAGHDHHPSHCEPVGLRVLPTYRGRFPTLAYDHAVWLAAAGNRSSIQDEVS
jgi:hypothetical protein